MVGERLYTPYKEPVVVGDWQLPDRCRNNRTTLAQCSGRHIGG